MWSLKIVSGAAAIYLKLFYKVSYRLQLRRIEQTIIPSEVCLEYRQLCNLGREQHLILRCVIGQELG